MTASKTPRVEELLAVLADVERDSKRAHESFVHAFPDATPTHTGNQLRLVRWLASSLAELVADSAMLGDVQEFGDPREMKECPEEHDLRLAVAWAREFRAARSLPETTDNG